MSYPEILISKAIFPICSSLDQTRFLKHLGDCFLDQILLDTLGNGIPREVLPIDSLSRRVGDCRIETFWVNEDLFPGVIPDEESFLSDPACSFPGTMASCLENSGRLY